MLNNRLISGCIGALAIGLSSIGAVAAPVALQEPIPLSTSSTSPDTTLNASPVERNRLDPSAESNERLIITPNDSDTSGSSNQMDPGVSEYSIIQSMPSINGSSMGTAGFLPSPTNPSGLLPAPLPPSSSLLPSLPTSSHGITSHIGSVSGGHSLGGH
jgi:hypothetical protein